MIKTLSNGSLSMEKDAIGNWHQNLCIDESLKGNEDKGEGKMIQNDL
jgi:hypothetical protein